MSLRDPHNHRLATPRIARNVAIEVQLPPETSSERLRQTQGEHVHRVCSYHGTYSVTKQKEFATKENGMTLLANEKNAEIKGLTARVINLEASLKIKSKEN